MNDTWILGDGAVAVSLPEGPVFADGAVAICGSRIAAAGKRETICSQFPDAKRVSAGGGVIVPGLVNLHHHFYSALARGLDPGSELNDFGAILNGLWWRLDRALGPEEVTLSALVSCVECVRWGVTSVFDHHASPSCVSGSLDRIASAVERAGLRAVLCYEVSDRNGHSEAQAGLTENFAFIEAHRQHPKIRGMLGLHASFTVDDSTLDEAARGRPAGAGCHIHLAEDRLDVEASRARYGHSPVERLLQRELVDERALLVHGVHLTEPDIAAIAEHEGTLIHNPESNQNNGVGRFDLRRAHAAGVAIGLGTDGMSSAILPALRSAFLGLRGGHADPTLGFTEVPHLLTTNRSFASRVFGNPLLGVLEPGAPADIAVFDCPSPTQISAQNLAAHLIYAVSQTPARHTVCDGRFLLRDYRFETVDPAAIAREARDRSSILWRRFREL